MELELQVSQYNTQEILFDVQNIANAFCKALEDNNCLVMLPINLHQQINDTYNDILDLSNAFTNANNLSNPDTSTNLGIRPTNNISSRDPTGALASAIASSKSNCFNCTLALPKIAFDFQLDFTLGKLKAQLDAYTNLFKVPNFCQAAFTMQGTCLPDIIKLIGFLITAYISIMSLTRISGLSLMGFIKGIIAAILGQLLASISLTVNLSSSTIGCLIDAFQQIADSIPTQNNLQAQLNAQQLEAIGLPPADSENTKNPLTNNLAFNSLKALNSGLGGTITADGILKSTPGLRNINTLIKDAQPDEIEKLIDQQASNVNAVNRALNDSFVLINTVITGAQKEINGYVRNLLGLKTYFECELSRSSADVQEILAFITNLTNVLNMLSSIAMMVAKKEARALLCKDKSNNIDPRQQADDSIKDFLQDYYNQTAVISKTSPDNLEVLLYDQPATNNLPKISLFDCSINDFIEAHSIENIISNATQQVLNESNPSVYQGVPYTTYTYNRPSDSTLGNVSSIMDLLYNNPIPTVATDTPVVDAIGVFGMTPDYKSYASSDTTDLKCRSVDDALKVLESLRGFK